MYIDTHVSANVIAGMLRCTRAATLYQDGYAFFLVQKGSVQLKIDGNGSLLKQGDIFLLPPDTQAAITPLAPNTLIRLELDRLYIDSLVPLGRSLQYSGDSVPEKEREALAKILEDIFGAYFEQDNAKKITAHLYLLADHLTKHNLSGPGDPEHPDLRFAERINDITALVHARYNQSITLGDLAEQLYLSPQYLSKFIKKNLGVSFSKFLTGIRLEHARNELLQTGHPITGIALNNGFPNVTAFNKAFREAYRVSPSAYKQNGRAGADRPEQETPYTASSAAGREIQIELDAASARPCGALWSDTVNIGNLAYALGSEFQEHFTQFQRAASVRYARCENIFSTELVRFHEAEDRLDCSRLYEAVDFLHRLEVRPFIHLTFRRDTGRNALTPVSRELPAERAPDDGYCRRVLDTVLPYFIRVYGLESVSRWRFEVTAGHDEYLHYDESPKDYIETYRRYYATVKKHCPACAVGGPGFNMSGRPGAYQAYLAAFERERLQFDVLSLFSYPYETVELPKSADPLSAGILSPDPDHARHRYGRYRDITAKTAFHALPLYITDFGSVLSSRNYIYDSVFQGSYLVKSYAGLLTETACAAYRGFWDSIPDISFSGAVYYSTCSLVSKNGIPKPSFHAYSLLSRLGKQLISAGGNHIMTADSPYRYQLLAFHYVHFHKDFRFNSWDRVPIEETYGVFETAEELTLQIHCAGITPGRYKVTQFSLNQNHGSALDKYLRVLENGTTTPAELLNTIMNFSAPEARYYRDTAVPRRDIYYISADSTLELSVTLSPHEIQLYELTKMI